MDYMFEYLFPTAVNSILLGVNDKQFSKKFRKAFLKVFRAMLATFGTDPDFVRSMRPYVLDVEATQAKLEDSKRVPQGLVGGAINSTQYKDRY